MFNFFCLGWFNWDDFNVFGGGVESTIMVHSLEFDFYATPTSAQALWLMPLTKHRDFIFVALSTNK